MNRRMVGLGLILGVLLLLPPRPVAGEPSALLVLTVKLSLAPPVTLRCRGPVTLYSLPEKGLALAPPLSNAPWREVYGGTIRHQLTWRVELVGGRILLASEQGDLLTTDLPLLLWSNDGSGFELDGAVYPGALVIWPADGLLFFNEVSLEDYVCGVLGSEAYAGWPMEALKANAVAIRSYTLYSLGKHEHYDLCDTIHCQVYRGLPPETVYRTAVRETAGEILCWQGAPINAVYHSSSGGRTRNNEEVWAGTPLPYLRSVEDFDHGGRNYQWPQDYLFSWDELTQSLGVARDQELRLVPFFNPAGERLGFWFYSHLTGKQLRNEELRRLLSLPSANFRIFIDPGETEITQAVTLPPGTNLLFTGKGAGHGVGLSQWGAADMASRGYSYRQILRHYYGPEVVLSSAGGQLRRQKSATQ
ncbi:SpoIID/LytB domain-containing protein [Capillibacterium thermochitinicola]|uniref:SpoIID/LytB domain-containing protein n=1 Tax=Capillibacterium thermochitinicola TaxID=2699427 RepID=A0A8J6HXV7_9FIRM|nr:SpoIID/LytB domain-containing protein [Capillibacterium thermochitinicola]MBA2131995.1 SpoIID/LytB domain-containing protein [Capillibacterium thermochitinicola]